MPRPLRIEYPNAWYHVMNRGAGRKKIFFSSLHRKVFLTLLQDACQKFGIEIHAYCLMSNHYHLLVHTPLGNLSRAMRHLNGVYTQKFNRIQQTDGPLFRGRYKSILVEEGGYQLYVSRYIHLNPVEAGIVESPKDYLWSSYRAYIDKRLRPVWLSTNIILRQFGLQEGSPVVKSYQSYVEKSEGQEVRDFYSRKYTSPILGSKLFKEKTLSALDESKRSASSPYIKLARCMPPIPYILEVVCQYYKVEIGELKKFQRGRKNWPKSVGVYICRQHFGYSLKSIAEEVTSISHVTVSTIICKCRDHLNGNPSLEQEVLYIVKMIKGNLQGDT